MAIKFVDKEPEDEASKRSKKTDAPPVAREPDGEALAASVDPDLPHAKPELKPRGRKKPMR